MTTPTTEVLSPASAIATTGDARRLILETMSALKAGAMRPDVGLAMAALMKGLNDSISTEINATKMSIQAEKEGHKFGRSVEMGKRLLG